MSENSIYFSENIILFSFFKWCYISKTSNVEVVNIYMFNLNLRFSIQIFSYLTF